MGHIFNNSLGSPFAPYRPIASLNPGLFLKAAAAGKSTMAAEIKLTKNDESPWGFRLTGGRDFGTPLTIIKVTAQSVAEESGLQVGDILVKINDVDCHDLTHKEAQDLIMLSNNSITFAVLRGNLSLSESVIDRLTPLPLRDVKTPEPNAQIRSESCNPVENTQTVPPAIEVIPIQDLEPELLEELGLNPLPEDFLEKAKRDPSPLPEVRPQSRMASPKDILDTLEEMGLTDMVEDIERQKEIVFHPPVEEAPAVQPEGPADPETADLVAEKVDPVVAPEQAVPVQKEEKDGTAQIKEEQPNVQPITDEEFAEFISGQEEVLEVEGKNALGVDFSKFEPKAEFLRKSQVFKSIQDSERVITREEKDQRWTTFLDKPKGPKPKPRPKPQPQYATISPSPKPPTPEPAAPETKPGLYDIPSEEEFAALVKVPTPPPVVEPEPQEPKSTEEAENVKQQLEEEQENLQQQLELEKQLNPEQFEGEEKSEIELQLEEIQKQLQAIQQLPFEIQQHLALVQQQLNQIVQHRLHEQDDGSEIPACPRPSLADPSLIEDHFQMVEPLERVDEEITEGKEEQEEETKIPEEAAPVEIPNVITEEKKTEFKLRTEEEPPILPPPKKEKPKKKRPFLGLGPAPRPLILPGGRRWRTPKDAYNEEFIAETLSAQAEIITGSTLGVNFRKYEPKPANLSHLRDSPVYKMIHDLEDPDVVNKGLARRPEIVRALQDYDQQSPPAAM